ncbi:MAG: Fatty acid desaturase [Verrucomicrobiaceae bacterium]|nr:Fatty acid desaturase [Verrucomicrobiaceae bacterium]
MKPLSTAEILASPSEPHWVSRSAFQIIVIFMALTNAALFAALYYNNYWLVVPLALVASHFMHGILIGFHEASHGLLRKNRRFNEFDGVLIGMLSFMSFSLYRASHQTHHSHLATERDEELWPFVDPKIPRWARVLAAQAELNAGLFVTPMLFLRSFFRQGSPIRAKKVRKRIWTELIMMGVFWLLVLSAVAWLHAWKYLLWMHFIPGMIAGNLQSWRKYIEHVGMAGDTPTSATRSIVSEGLAGRVVAFTLLHEPFHGLHHRHVGLPHAALPPLAPSLTPQMPGETHPFTSYRHALMDLIRSLGDPRVGPHWQTKATTAGLPPESGQQC